MSDNRLNKLYSIRVDSKKFIMPPFCTCCMAPTQEKQRIYSYYVEESIFGRETRTIETEVPICNECHAHQKNFTMLKRLLFFVSILCGVFLGAYANRHEENIMPIVSTATSFLMYFLLTLIIKTKKLPQNHTTRYESVTMSSPFLALGQRGPFVILNFTNLEYAKLFQKANADYSHEITETEKTNTANSTRVYEISKPNRVNFLIMFIVSIVAFGLIDMLK